VSATAFVATVMRRRPAAHRLAAVMLHLLTDDLRRDPYPMYAQLRPASPLHIEAANLWLLLDHEGVRRALTDSESFASSVDLPTGKAPDWLVFSDPPRHTRLRALILRAFTPRAVAALEPRVREISRQLLDPLRARGELDLVADYAGPLPTLVIADMLGIPAADRPRFLRWSATIVNLSHVLADADAAARAVAEHAAVKAEMQAYLEDLLAARRDVATDDLLHGLATAEIDGERLGLPDILGFFQLLLAAGTETTTNLIDNAILALLEHPDQRARLDAEPDLLPAAIEEVLRHRSPLQMVFRQTLRPVALSGKTIPAGQLVLVLLGAANRDPAAFPDPDRFDITRAQTHHLGFGHGIHFCIGAALSRLEARVALPDLLALPGLARASDEPWTPREALLVHGPASLPLRFTPA
jgi:cytochrome P450